MKNQINPIASLVLILMSVLFLNTANAQSTVNYTLSSTSKNITTQLTAGNNIVVTNTLATSVYSVALFSYNTNATTINIPLFDVNNTTYNDGVLYVQKGATTTTITILQNVTNIAIKVTQKLINQFVINNFINGTVTGIESVQTQPELGLKVFPNPTVSEVNVSVNSAVEDKDVTIFLYSITGQLVYEEKVSPSPEPHKLNVDNYARGTYILQIKQEDAVKTQKLILQ